MFGEARGEACKTALAKSTSTAISTGTLAELYIVTAKPELRAIADDFLADLEYQPFSVDGDFARRLGAAYSVWGKGFHPARLNMGDCYAYTLAKQLNRPLLFIGNDFSQTDIRSVLENPDPEFA